MAHDPYGCYRSLEPRGALPQNAWKLDNDPAPQPGETAVDVDVLNVDSSSFRQLAEQSRNEGLSIADIIERIVTQRGKLHNPITGSGGMLIGAIPPGQRIAALVSLSLTPLKIESIERVDDARERVYVKAKAILFEKTLYCPLPSDFSETAALAILDVAGAPARVARLCQGVGSVLILGAGKAGLLTAAAVRRENPRARILAIDTRSAALQQMRELDLCDWCTACDAGKPLEVFEAVKEATAERLCDLAVNLVNQPNTEGASILATRDGGRVYFFGMSTSFSRAALTAEGVARDIDMMIGSGYTAGWSDYALNLARSHNGLRAYFESRYGE